MHTEPIQMTIVGDHVIKPYTKQRVACRGLLIRDGKILLSHFASDDVYMTPGGGQEDGETLTECCAREVCEETGVLVRVGDEFFCIDEYDGEYRHISRYFFCEPIGEGIQKLTDHEIRCGLTTSWVDLETAYEIFSHYAEYAQTCTSKRNIYRREYAVLGAYLNQN